MDELMKGRAVSDEGKPLFQQLRDAYLDFIFEKFPGGVHYPINTEPFKYFPEGFIQKSRSQWPQDMEILLKKLQSDRERYIVSLVQRSEKKAHRGEA